MSTVPGPIIMAAVPVIMECNRSNHTAAAETNRQFQIFVRV